MNKEVEEDKENTGTWAINNFPMDLKNRFAGELKRQGISIKDGLVNLIIQWLKERKA